MARTSIWRGACAGALGVVLAGCGPGRVDLGAAGRVHVDDVGSKMVDVGRPTVVADGDDLVVSGTVARRPGFDGPVPGRLVITVLAADGQTVLQEFGTGWDPTHIPLDGDRRSTYRVRYGWLPPDGATVRVGHEPDPNVPITDDAKYSKGYRATDARGQRRSTQGALRPQVTQQQIRP